MVDLINDYGTFSNFLLVAMTDILSWLMDNPIGEIFIFLIVIAISMAIIEFIVSLRQMQ